jgi:cytochrome c553
MLKFSICAALLAAAPLAQAQPADKPAGSGAAVTHTGGVAALCIGCHGISGYKVAYPHVYHVPKIAGQSPKYIEAALKAYQSGERKHPTMRAIAQALSDKEITALAAYYGGGAK